MKFAKIVSLVVMTAALGVMFNCGSETESVFREDAGVVDSAPDNEWFPPGFGDASKPCFNLECKQVQCDGGAKTTVTGNVFDPAGKVPLYNALVYVPNAPIDPIKTGASCERCGNVSGSPLVSAITGPDGKFVLENVPAGDNIPLVVQIGKWRRQLTIPKVDACVATSTVDGEIRLPRNQSEGDMPQMALASGNADPFECLLTKMGIDVVEFTHDTGTGRVHYFRENGINTNPAAPAASTLYSDAAKLKAYDIVFLPCEGGEHNRPEVIDQNIVDYTAVGGRIFTTHYGYSWLHQGVQPFPTTGQWQPGQSDRFNTVLPTTINQSFPKGAAFAQWLVNVNASTTLGTMDIREGRHDLNAANDPPSTAWMTTTQMPTPNTNATMHITFNTPIGVPEAEQCGRVVFSDFHVSASALSGQPNFPQSCKPGDLSAQEKALEFMLFDLSSCIQDDKKPPQTPVK